MVVGFTTTYAISCLSPLTLWVRTPLRQGVLDTTFCDKVCQWLGQWFPPGTLVSSTNKTDHHDITEILLKVALKTINHTKPLQQCFGQRYQIWKNYLNNMYGLIHTFNIQVFSLYPRSPKGEGGILFYLCPSVRPSFRLSFRPSKIFFVAFFSVTVDGRNLIFGPKHHIGIPYCG
jgi:hypothetical protein